MKFCYPLYTTFGFDIAHLNSNEIQCAFKAYATQSKIVKIVKKDLGSIFTLLSVFLAIETALKHSIKI